MRANFVQQPDRQQELHVAWAAAEAFVDATLRLVPLGRETNLIEFDGWLLELAP